MTFVQRRHSKRVPGPRPVALSQVPSTAAEVQQDRIQQALYRHTVRPVTAQRQLAAPVLRAASLDRAEAARLDVQRQSAQRQLSALAVPAERPASPATRPAPARPTTPDEWVTVLRHRAEGIEGQRLDTRTFGEFQALQRQVAQHLAQGFRADRGDAQARYASYGEQLATLQRHALSAPVARVVLGMVPPVERIPLQRATDEALQRLQAQEHAALAFDTVQALQRQLAELDAEVAQPVLARIQARRGAGNPLPEAVRRHLEQGLNHDLSRVRIHDDTEADKLAKGVNAIAFTTGTDIFFRSGHFNPNTQTGLELLAHEVTHTVQQSQGRVGTGIDPDAGLEGEARAMGAKLAQVMPSPKTVLPPVPHQHGSHAPGVYTKAAALGRAQQGAVTAALHQPFQALGLQRQVMPTLQRSFLGDQISGLAGQIPGYRELCLAFGKDLVTGKTLAQNPNAILDALAKLVPGPFQDMLRAVRGQNLIPKAWAWFQGELGKLQLGQALSEVKAAVTKFPPDLGAARSALTRRADGLKRLVSGAAKHLAGIALTAIEAGLGPVGKKVMGLLRQSGDVVMQVLRDPAKFAGNLLRALTQGFTQFRSNAGRWLKDGLGTWLTGASGIQFPATLDLKGVFLTALSVMGLTYHALRGRLVKELGPGGEQKVALAEKAGGALATLTKGLHQAPEVKGQQGAIGQGVVDSLKKEVTTSLVTAGAAKVASLLVPGGAFVQALLTAFSGVQTLISQGSQIMGVILNALGSVQAIAAGQVAAAAGFVERTIGGSIPIVLTFLGRLVGLGNIGTRIRNTVKKLRTRLDATIDKLIGRVRKAIGQAKTTVVNTAGQAQRFLSGLFGKRGFETKKKQHRIWIEVKKGEPTVWIASTPREARTQLHYAHTEAVAKNPASRAEADRYLAQGEALVQQALQAMRSASPASGRRGNAQVYTQQLAAQHTAALVPVSTALLDLAEAGENGQGKTLPEYTVTFGCKPSLNLNEYRRQLILSQSVLRRLTVETFFKRRAQYDFVVPFEKVERGVRDRTGRDDLLEGPAMRAARKAAQQQLEDILATPTRALSKAQWTSAQSVLKLLQKLQDGARQQLTTERDAGQRARLTKRLQEAEDHAEYLSGAVRARNDREATRVARKILGSLAALHKLDQVAGGQPHELAGSGLRAYGDARVDFSIGASWGAQNRLAGLERHIRSHVAVRYYGSVTLTPISLHVEQT